MSEDINDITDPYTIIDAYFKAKPKRLCEHQIDSYNNFVNVLLNKVIKSFSNWKIIVDVEKLRTKKIKGILEKYIKFLHTIDFTKVCVTRPSYEESGKGEVSIFPNDARVRNLTYQSAVYVHAVHTILPIDKDGKPGEAIVHKYENENRIRIGAIPVMIRSDLCNISIAERRTKETQYIQTDAVYKAGEDIYDLGGYFIVNGSEKNIMGQESKADNYVYFYDNRDEADAKKPYPFTCEVKSKSEEFDMANSVTIYFDRRDRQISVQFGSSKFINRERKIPIMVLFRALGIDSDRTAVELCVGDIEQNKDMVEILLFSNLERIEDPATGETLKVRTQSDALKYIASLITEKSRVFKDPDDLAGFVRGFLNKHLFPHIGKFPGESDDDIRKAFFLGYMVNKLLMGVTGKIKPDNIDALYNKRVEIAGVLMAQLLKQLMINLMETIQKQINSMSTTRLMSVADFEDMLPTVLHAGQVEPGFRNAFSTGKWTITRSNRVYSRQSVTKKMERKSFLDMLSSQRRLMIPVQKANQGKNEGLRMIQGTQWGYEDPVESPEGENIGLIKNMAVMASISIASDPRPVINEIADLYKDVLVIFEEGLLARISYMTKLFVNGDLIGFTEEPKKICDKIRGLRQRGMIDYSVSVVRDFKMNHVLIFTDGGRMIRPLLIVGENNKLKIKASHIEKLKNGELRWNDLLFGGIIEYIDSHEAAFNCVVATTPTELRMVDPDLKIYTHCEIHASSILSVCSCLVPFANHNQSPRNIYQTAMAKQSLGVYACNYRLRTDKLGHVLYYPERPLCNTLWAQYIHPICAESGMNAVVAIMCHTGYNQEDSVIMNLSSAERGFMNSSYYKLYRGEAKQGEKFMKPNPEITIGMRPNSNFDHLTHDGRVVVGQVVHEGDMIIGKVTAIDKSGEKMLEKFEFKDQSEELKDETAIVDRVIVDKDSDGWWFNKTRVRIDRVPDFGDKFCHTPDTDVLTADGWKNITKVTKEDLVCTLNPENHNIEYHNPFIVKEFDHDGDMYELTSQMINLCVTLTHKLYVRRRDHKEWELLPASEVMGKRVQHKRDAINSLPDQEKFILPENDEFKAEEIDMDSWLKLFGLWISDGWVTYNDKQKSYTLTIAAKKERKIKELKEIFSNLNLSFRHVEDRWQWNINHKHMAMYLIKYSVGATNKYLPEWVFNLSQRQANILLEYLIKGDGSIDKTHTRYFTSSIKLRDDIQRLALHCGLSANIELKSKAGTPYEIVGVSKGVTTADYWNITITTARNEPWVNHGKADVMYPIKERIIKYTGKVYGIDIKNHIIYVRRGFTPVWTGNSSRHGQKGTMSLIIPQYEMPYCEKTGITPDIIINPHAFPSRMTVAHLVECIAGKSGACHGVFTDATPFTNSSVKEFQTQLEACGFKNDGTEVLYNGFTGEKMKCMIFIGPTFYQKLKHMTADKMHCLTPDHDVLTSQGWKSIKDVTTNDYAASLNINTNALEYHKVLKTYEYDLENTDMYHIESQQIDLTTTLNHKMYVGKRKGNRYEFGLIEAGELYKKNVKYKKNCEGLDRPSHEKYQFKDEKGIVLLEVPMKPWLRYFGMWISDGYCTDTGRPCIKFQKERKHDYVTQQLDDMKVSYNEYIAVRDGGHIEYCETIFEDPITVELRKLSIGAHNKRLPDWVWELNKEETQILLEGLIEGDGTHRGVSVSYYTSSQGLADDVQRLALHAGFSANIVIHIKKGNISTIHGREIIAQYDILKVGIVKSKNTPEVNHAHVKEQHIQKEEIFKYTGKVYCIEVPNHIFYVRRNMKPVWTGNSRSIGSTQLLTKQPMEGRARQGGLRFGEMERDALIAHGMSYMLLERFFNCSDPYVMYFCDQCGLPAVGNPEQDLYFCPKCGNDRMISRVNFAYSAKLMCQEATSLNCVPFFKFSKYRNYK